MPLPAIRQRIGRLEALFVVDRAAGYPPLTAEEIEAMVGRLAAGQDWTDVETARVARQCPFIKGELVSDHDRPTGPSDNQAVTGDRHGFGLMGMGSQMHADALRCAQK